MSKIYDNFEERYTELAEELSEQIGYWPNKRQVLEYYLEVNGLLETRAVVNPAANLLDEAS